MYKCRFYDGNGTTPVIVNERTLVPIRAIIEAMGGTVGWDGETQTITVTKAAGETEEVKDSNILVAYFTAAENGEVDAISEATISTYNGKDAGAAEAKADVESWLAGCKD